jgi:beta-glucosidase
MGISAAINGYTCAQGESSNEKEECDRTTVDLPGAQLPFLQALAGTGKPLVLVLLNGGMLEVSWAQDSPAVSSIVHLPYLGMSTGTALGRVLTGQVNPAGRLTATWYSPTGMQAIGGPLEYRLYPDASDGYPGRTYMYHALPGGHGVTYPFGWGLSYSTFVYSDPMVNNTAPGPCDVLTLSVDVTNTGTVDGSEALQLYISHPSSPAPGGLPAVPIRTLVDFDRVAVPAGTTVTVTLLLDRYRNSLYSQPDIISTVYPGARTLWVGGCSDPSRCAGASLQVDVTGQPTPVTQCS